MARTHAIVLLTIPCLAMSLGSVAHAQTSGAAGGLPPSASAPGPAPDGPAAGQPQAPATQTQPALTPAQWMDRADQAMAVPDYPAAIAAFNQVLQAEPGNTTAIVGLAEAHMKTGNLLQARDLYNALLKANPNDWRGHFGLGTIYLQQSYFKLARPYLERAANLAPMQSRSRVLLNLALTYRGLYQAADAIDRARRALQYDPSNVDARRVLIGLYLENNRLDEAAAENNVALQMARKNAADRPDDRLAVEVLAQTLMQGVDLLQRKVDAQPDDVQTRLQLADMMEQQSLANQQMVYHRSLELLAPLREKTPDNVELLIAYSRLLYLIGRPGQAVEDLRRALSLAPDNAQARQWLEKAEAAQKLASPVGSSSSQPSS